MNKYPLLFICLVSLILAGFTRPGYSQSRYKISNSQSNRIKLSGTSTLHKWEMNANEFAGVAKFFFSSTDATKLTSVSFLDFSLDVLKLKSEDDGLDNNAYEALNSTEHAEILFQLISASVVPTSENKYLISTIGNLTVAGVTKKINLDVNCVINKDASITCTGSEQLRMTDYEVKPPSFLLGMMKTADAIVLDFIIVYQRVTSI